MNPSGGGFIYFPTSLPQAKTSEFMAFDESPVKELSPQNFTPRNYSSPQNKQRNNTRGHNSGRNFYSKKPWQNNSHSPYRTSNNRSNYNYTNQSYKSNGDKTFSKQDYLHPSFTEDPWAHLEKKLNKQNTAEQSDVSMDNSSFEHNTSMN
ncbi:PREDICTED: uncharacterized protein LOC108564727 [Nicrophorus vespilloides]|uniref:Uncharacterized protein LOC108564727 n=1 Tax=Nicrophorus vespilloides TaxID=110193 RepID=A0ABM1MXL7_NICVS|nr:PREDICTED: uncharacterized protein LOC108564727 [Nicrophorus vespilloides]